MQRKPSRLFGSPTKRVMMFVALTLMSFALTGCQTTGSVGTDCLVFKPIYWSKDDTLETAKQVREHNAAWKAVCGQTN